MELIEFLILSLAAYRVAVMLADVEQEGPFGLLAKFRHLAGVRFDELSQPFGKNTLAVGLLCTYCNSVWLGLIALAAFLLLGDLSVLIAMPLAVSGFVVIAEK